EASALQLGRADAGPRQAAKLGLFWHTQGSGKTVSMIFFTQKVLRTMPGNWTFVIITDREDLDDQVYKEFTAAGIVEDHVQATSTSHLRRLLEEDHRYVFTLIQKFPDRTGDALLWRHQCPLRPRQRRPLVGRPHVRPNNA